MDAFITHRRLDVDHPRVSLDEMPVGSLVSIEGFTYLKASNGIVAIDYDGNLQTISEKTSQYLKTKIPRVVHGTFRFYPLG